ncbi:MAG: response regulator transcription factor [Alphaproteobacteria bacterium]|nr:response regulator transcription factor [Alphaproteobacteria bacterium]
MRALIADSHALIRTGLCQLLKGVAPSLEVIEAADFEQAVRALEQRGPFDLVLVDLDLPQMQSVAGIRTLADHAGKTPLVVVAEQDDPRGVEACMAAGALGYLPKSSSRDVIVGGLRLVLLGGMYLPPALLRQRAPRRADAPGLRVEPLAGAARGLTRRQRDVLELLSLGRSNKEIAQALGLAEGTVKIHVSAIFKVLGVANRTEATARMLNAH